MSYKIQNKEVCNSYCNLWSRSRLFLYFKYMISFNIYQCFSDDYLVLVIAFRNEVWIDAIESRTGSRTEKFPC